MSSAHQLTQDQAIHRAIASRYGFAVLPSIDATGPKAYTVGLTEQSVPELVVFGLLRAVAGNVINAVATALRTPEGLPSGEPVSGVLADGVPLMLLPVTDSSVELPEANRFYRLSDPVAALQIVFPDERGVWPWEPGSLLADMPLLGAPRV